MYDQKGGQRTECRDMDTDQGTSPLARLAPSHKLHAGRDAKGNFAECTGEKYGGVAGHEQAIQVGTEAEPGVGEQGDQATHPEHEVGWPPRVAPGDGDYGTLLDDNGDREPQQAEPER